MRLASRRTLFPATPLPPAPTKTTTFLSLRHIHHTPAAPATVSPVLGNGPPPEPPSSAADSSAQRLARRKKQAELLRQAADIRKSQQQSSKKKQPGQEDRPKPRRFWKDVSVQEVDGALEVHLDQRPLRHPTTKQIVRLPLTKPMLASALALEWDLLTSVQQATRQHLIPLTSLVCRAVDIAEDDEATHAKGAAHESLRAGIAKTVLRYLDTDTLLCFAPPPASYDVVEDKESLRETQERVFKDVVGFLTSRVWPGVAIEPVLDGESLMPKSHSAETRAVVEGWVMGLSAWELAGLERGVLAGKGLLGAVRLVVEWSEGPAGLGHADANNKKFGVEEAAQAASLEVDWQISNWGEVEDTHDVEKEDLRRQLGSVVLLVSGTGKQ